MIFILLFCCIYLYICDYGENYYFDRGYLYICDWQVFIAEWVNIYYWNLIYCNENFMFYNNLSKKLCLCQDINEICQQVY